MSEPSGLIDELAVCTAVLCPRQTGPAVQIDKPSESVSTDENMGRPSPASSNSSLLLPTHLKLARSIS